MRLSLPSLLVAALLSFTGERLAADPIGPIEAKAFAVEKTNTESLLADPPVEPGYAGGEGNVMRAPIAASAPPQLIPEPATLALLVGGLTGLAYAGRSRPPR